MTQKEKAEMDQKIADAKINDKAVQQCIDRIEHNKKAADKILEAVQKVRPETTAEEVMFASLWAYTEYINEQMNMIGMSVMLGTMTKNPSQDMN